MPERINSPLESEGGVVAQRKRFGMRLFNMMCERPPRLRRCGSFAAFYYCAATPPLEEGNPLTYPFIHTFFSRRLRSARISREWQPWVSWQKEVPMSHRILFTLAVMIAVVLSAPIPAAGQTISTPAKSWTPARTADGQPDLQGIWNNSTMTPLERPAELEGKEFFTAERLRMKSSCFNKAMRIAGMEAPQPMSDAPTTNSRATAAVSCAQGELHSSWTHATGEFLR